AKIVDVRARRIHEALDRNEIVLVAGFQGVSSEHEVTTLGRGGSDTTAVALAAALGAHACEIYTDVEGVYTADPQLVPNARRLEALSHEEMLEMASSGARVMATRRSPRARFARRAVERPRRPREGLARRRGNEEPSRSRRQDVRNVGGSGHRSADRLHVTDQDRLSCRQRRRRPRRPGAPRGVRAW